VLTTVKGHDDGGGDDSDDDGGDGDDEFSRLRVYHSWALGLHD
jgi:hypothetical protein